jgi:hypothetical protein
MAENKARKRYRDRVRRQLKKKAKREYKIMRGSSGDLVAIQIAAQIKKLPKGFKLTREFIEEAIRHKANTSEGYWDGVRVVDAKEGEDAPGMRLIIQRWKNPDRDLLEDRSYRYATDSAEDQADAWGSLRRIIAKASLSVRIDGNS